MKVEVDIEDLETIVFATAAIKTIESTLAARKTDPFVQTHLAYTQAHDNLVGAMNAARRGVAKDTLVEWDGELTKKEKKILTDCVIHEHIKIAAADRLETPEIDSLAAKGMVLIGQSIYGASWPGQSRPTLKPLPEYLVMATPRGRQKYEDTLMKAANDAGII